VVAELGSWATTIFEILSSGNDPTILGKQQLGKVSSFLTFVLKVDYYVTFVLKVDYYDFINNVESNIIVLSCFLEV
jgi:hypothetical protein